MKWKNKNLKKNSKYTGNGRRIEYLWCLSDDRWMIERKKGGRD